jgi:hypothetical protein
MRATKATDLTRAERDAYTSMLERAWPLIASNLRDVSGVDDKEEFEYCVLVVDRAALFTRALERGPGVRDFFTQFERGPDELRVAIVNAEWLADFMHRLAPQRTDFPRKILTDVPGHVGCMLFGPGAFFMAVPSVLGVAEEVRCLWPDKTAQPFIAPHFEPASSSEPSKTMSAQLCANDGEPSRVGRAAAH